QVVCVRILVILFSGRYMASATGRSGRCQRPVNSSTRRNAVNHLKAFLLVIALLISAIPSTRGGDVVINEIMYHPAPAMPESNAWEWVELHNKGTNAINLAGWKFTKGIDFTFSNIVLAPDGYLVVAADRVAFNSLYPAVTNVVGNWHGTLGN